MKKLYPLLLILVMLGIIAVVFVSMTKNDQPIAIIKGNTKREVLPLKVNFTNDPYCKMLITTQRNALQVVSPDGNTWFFDDPGCMILWLENKAFKESAKIWVYAIDTQKWIDAKTAWYGEKDDTAMGYGFAAREEQAEDTIDFKEMQLRMLRGENLANPKIRKKLLGK